MCDFSLMIIKIFSYLKFLISEDSSLNSLSNNDIARLAQKDPEYFAILYDRLFDKIYKFFHFRTRDQRLSEDLTSDTFEKIFVNLNNFKDAGVPIEAWIFKIARNILINQYRKNNNTIIENIDDVIGNNEPREDFDCTKLDEEIMGERLWEIIHKLPENYQDLWGLKLTKDLSHKEIARILGVTEQNINVMIHRSIKRFKTSLSSLEE